MKIEFLGAAHEVTGSCTLLYACGKRIMIDCGMEQGPDTYENCSLPLAPGDVDYVLLTHAHIDHSGRIPFLVANGYKNPVYATAATTKLCEIMLKDSAHIQETEAIWRNRKAERVNGEPYIPPYTMEDVENTLPLFVPCNYEETYEICDGVVIRFIDAGHLLGSSSIEITVTEGGETKTILFSGDVGNINRPLVNDPTKPEKADYVIIESTYGNRLHGERIDYTSQLVSILQNTFDRGGNVVIPSFAVGRTQELLYLIHGIKQQKLVKGHGDFPVWIDSPLAIEATNIYCNSIMGYSNDSIDMFRENSCILGLNGLNFALTSEESKSINEDRTPKVIISASGMCEAGRIRHHLKHNLWRDDSTILFVGYQAEGTLGRTLQSGVKSVKLFGEKINVNAEIRKVEGISGHADQKILLDWLGNIKKKPTQVFVNHGADLVCDEFAQVIKDVLKINTVAPYNGAVYDLTTGECLNEGNKIRINKDAYKKKVVSSVFEKLLMAGNRLMSAIEKNKGSTNKDIAKFTSQINDLCSKWE